MVFIIFMSQGGGSNVSVTSTTLSGDIVIPSSITYNGNTYTVNEIDYRFIDNTEKLNSYKTVTSVTIPSTISIISVKAFGQSEALTAINVDPANQWFTSDDGILYNKDKTKLIYYPCKKDASHFTIPSSVTTLGGEAFCHHQTLTSIVIPKTVTTIEDAEESQGLGSKTGWKYGVFSNCDKLTSVTFEDGCNILEIPRYFLFKCTSLTSINIPKTVTKIKQEAFMNCSSLSSIIIPESVTIIEDYAFCDCKKLITKLPSKLEEMYSGTFEGCTSLTEIEFPKSLGHRWGSSWFSECSNLKKVVIPDDCALTVIPAYCFAYDNALTDVTLSKNIKIIYGGAFRECYSLEKINLPEALTTIEYGAFLDCIKLKDITFHDKLKDIGYEAFSYCYSLADINLPSSLETVEEGAFERTSCTTFTIPASVTSFASTALLRTHKLQEIKVAEGNTAYTAIDGVLFTKDKKTLVTYPIGSDRRVAYQVPYGVETIDEGAFDNSKLAHVTLPSTTITIYNGAFTCCQNMTELTIPASVKNIIRKNCKECAYTTVDYKKTLIRGSSIHSIFLLNNTAVPTTNLGFLNVFTSAFDILLYYNCPAIYVKPSAYANKIYQNADGWKIYDKVIFDQIPVTIPASGMKSMGRDFDVDLSSSNLTAYVAQGAKNDGTCKQVNMVPIAVSGKTDGKYVPSRMGTTTDNGVEYEKYEGVILKGEPGRVYYTIGEDDDAVTEQTNYLVPATDATKVTMTEEKNGVAYTNLGLKNGAFRYFIADGTIPYNKCWLSLPTSIVGTYDSQSGAKALSMNFTDNEATAIRDLTYPTYSDGAYYTLQGVRVSHPEHGIFIHNGKKVILK